MQTQTATQVVQQTVLAARNTQLQVWLQPKSIPAHLQRPWSELCQQMQTQVSEALNEEFMRRLSQSLESKGMDEETLQDTVMIIILKKIRNILDKILDQFPPGVMKQALAVMDEIDAELHEGGPGGNGKGSGKGDGNRKGTGNQGAANGAPFNNSYSSGSNPSYNLGGAGAAGNAYGAAGYARGTGGTPIAGNANYNAFPSHAQGTPGASYDRRPSYGSSLPMDLFPSGAQGAPGASLPMDPLRSGGAMAAQPGQQRAAGGMMYQQGQLGASGNMMYQQGQQGQQGASVPYPQNRDARNMPQARSTRPW